MKKNVKNFLKYLETETSIQIDLASKSKTLKTVNSLNSPICINVFGIYEGTLGLAIISCGCKKCKNIIGIEVLYGLNDSEINDAILVKELIISAVPEMQVEISHVDEEDLK